MNEQLLTNIWDIFSADGLTENDYEVWKSNFSKSEEFQKNGYEYLQSKGYTSSDFSQWKNNVFNTVADPSDDEQPKNIITDRGDGYHYKYELEPGTTNLSYFAKEEGADDWVKASGDAEESISSVFGHSVYVPKEEEEEVKPKKKKESEQERMLRLEEEKVEKKRKALEKRTLELQEEMPTVSVDIVKRNDAKVVASLNAQWSKYGFSFDNKGAGEFVTITAKNGKSKKFPVQNIAQPKKNARVANEMYQFMLANINVEIDEDLLDIQDEDLQATIDYVRPTKEDDSKVDATNSANLDNYINAQIKAENLDPEAIESEGLIVAPDSETTQVTDFKVPTIIEDPDSVKLELFTDEEIDDPEDVLPEEEEELPSVILSEAQSYEGTRVDQIFKQTRRTMAKSKLADELGLKGKEKDNFVINTPAEYNDRVEEMYKSIPLDDSQLRLAVKQQLDQEARREIVDDNINLYIKNLKRGGKKESDQQKKLRAAAIEEYEKVKNQLGEKEADAIAKMKKFSDTIPQLDEEIKTLEKGLNKIKKDFDIKLAQIQAKIKNNEYSTQEELDKDKAVLSNLKKQGDDMFASYELRTKERTTIYDAAVKANEELENLVIKEEDLALFTKSIGKNYTRHVQNIAVLKDALTGFADNAEEFLYMINPFGAIADELISQDSEVAVNSAGEVRDVVQFGKHLHNYFFTDPLSVIDPERKDFISSLDSGEDPTVYRNKIKKGIDNYQKSIWENVGPLLEFGDIKDFWDFADWGLTSMIGQTPVLATIFATGGAALPILGGVSAGAKFESMKKEREQWRLSKGLYGNDYTFGQMYVNSILTGVFEGLSEQITLGQARGVKKALFSTTKNNAKRGAINFLKREIFSYEALKNLKYLGRDLTSEGLSEGAATLSSNFLDQMSGKKISIWEGVDEAFVSGVVISSGMKSPLAVKSMLRPFQTESNSLQIVSNANRINELSNLIAKRDLTQENMDAYETEIAELTHENAKLMEEDIKRVDMLTDVEKRELIDIETENYDYVERIGQIEAESKLTAEEKKAEISKITNRIQSNLNRKAEVLDKVDVRENYAEQMETLKKNKEAADKLNIDIQITEGGNAEGETLQNDINQDDVQLSDGSTVPSSTFFPGVLESINNLLKDPSISVKEKVELRKERKEIENIIKNNSNIVKGGAAEYGFITPVVKDKDKLGFNIFINKDKALDNGVVTTPVHEFLHALLFTTLKRDVDTQAAFGQAALEELKTGVENGYIKIKPDTDLFVRLDQYTPDQGKGEEMLTLLSEAITKGDITFHEGTFKRVGHAVRRALQGVGLRDIRFNNSRDVFNFVRDYSKTFKEGKVIDKSMQKMMKQGAEGELLRDGEVVRTSDTLSFAKGKSSQLQAKLDAADGDKIALMRDLLDTGKDFENSKFAKEIGGITESITQRLFDPLAIKAPNSLDVIPGTLKVTGAKVTGTKRDAYKKALVEKAINLVVREYEVGTQPLDKFVSTRLSLRANALATELGVEQEFTTKIDNISESEIQDFNEQQDKEIEEFEKQDIRAQMLAEARGEKTPDGLPLILNAIGKPELISKINNIVKKAKLNLTDIKSIKDVKALVAKKGGPLNEILNLVASEFGVESSRIIKNQDLNADQRAPAREFINSKAEALKKMLIKGDTADGKATGAANTALGPAFYIKGARVAAAQTGSTQGKPTQILNPNITTDSFKKAFEGKGTSKDSIIKALIVQVATVSANQAIRKTAPKSTPEAVTSKIADGMSSAYFSKTIDKKLNNNKPIEIAKGLFIVETLNANAKNIKPENVKQEIQAMFADALNAKGDAIITQKELDNIIQDVEAVSKIITKKKIKSDVIDLQGGTIGDFIVNETIESAETFKPLRSLKKIQTRRTGQTKFKSMSDPKVENERLFIAKVRIGHNLIAREMNKIYPGFGEVFLIQGLGRSAKVHKGGIVFTSLTKYKKSGEVGQARGGYANNTADARFISDAKKGERGDFKDTVNPPGGLLYKDFNKVKDNLDNIIESQKQDNKALRLVADKMKELYDADKISADVARQIIQSMNANPSGLIRRAAVIDWLPLGKWSGKATYEHMTPSSKIADAMLDYVLSEKDTTAKDYFTELMDTYTATYMPPKQNDFINKFFKSTMPLWWNTALPPILRYFNLYTIDGMGDIRFEHVGTKQKIGAEIITDKKAYNKLIKNSKGILDDFNNDAFTPHNIVEGAKIVRNTFYNSKSINEDGKGGSVWDFDDTIARSKSKVISTAPDGTTVSLTAEQFADQGAALLQQGHKFDFSEFNKVVKGEKGPFFKKFADRIKKFGVKDNFILTARPVESAPAIQAFLKSQGINIPLKNITALANSTPEAKALWIAENMISKGYNDIYFADDALQNVQAVKNIMDQFDVKGKVQQAKIQFSKSGPVKMDEILMDGEIDIDSDFNAIIDEKFKGKRKKSKFTFFIPPSAEDFEGLLYPLLGKGKEGEKHHKFFKEKLFDPFAKGVRAYNMAAQEVGIDVKKIKKSMPGIAKTLQKKVPNTMYTLDDAARVYLWDKAGYDIPFLSKGDKAKLLKAAQNNPTIQIYAEKLNQVADKLKGYPEPGNNWLAGNTNYDMSQLARKSRDAFLKEWKENVDVLFSETNLKKLERLLGVDYVESLRDSLHRMETGSNRSLSKYKFVNDFMDWINGSIATTMFVNMRSALLQTLSTVNFLNWHDNNLLSAGKAYANLPQFTKDFTMIFNSDFLKQRRGGLQMDLNANEMLKSIQDSKNPIRATVGWILKQGFKPTQIMDSFAIAAGGAAMYRNRVNTYVKQGLTQAQAQETAFNDMMEIAEATQQSSRPDRISAQQASPLGKLILAFQNTPMQYMRLTKKAALDLFNGRGDAKTNISKIIYYSVAQNIIFYSMQQALFALAFGDDEDEDEEKRKQFEDKKKLRTINGMLDTILRGTGIAGAVVSTVKNALMTYMQQRKKWDPDHGYTMVEVLNLSPPIGIKARKLYTGAIKNYEWNEDVIKYMSKTDIDNPIYKAIFSTIEATTNIPLARAQSKLNNIREAFDADNKNWQRIALFMGWSTWDLGIQNDELADIKDEITEIKKLERKQKREEKKREEAEKLEQEFKKQQEKEKEEGKKEITCIAVNKDGKRCGLKVVGGGSYCTVHQKVEQGDKEVQCKKIKSDGKRCKMKTKNKSGLCYYHD